VFAGSVDDPASFTGGICGTIVGNTLTLGGTERGSFLATGAGGKGAYCRAAAVAEAAHSVPLPPELVVLTLPEGR